MSNTIPDDKWKSLQDRAIKANPDHANIIPKTKEQAAKNKMWNQVYHKRGNN